MVIKKLFNTGLALVNGEDPNKEDLITGCSAIIELLESPPLLPQPLLRCIEFLKETLFYKQYGLGSNQEFLKLLANKIDDINVINIILGWELTNDERQTFSQRLASLTLMGELYSLLDKLVFIKNSQKENEAYQYVIDDLFQLEELIFFNLKDDFTITDKVYFFSTDFKESKAYALLLNELDQLDDMLCSGSVTVADIKVFFYSALFIFLFIIVPYSAYNYNFNYDIETIYNILLENSEITTRNDLNKHKEVLLKAYNELAQLSKQDHTFSVNFNLRNLLASLNAKGRELNPRLISSLPNESVLFKRQFRHKRHESHPLSPIAKQLVANLKKQYRMR